MNDERDRISDPKLIFYLERRKQIDEWGQLVNLEKAAANAFLRSLLPDVLDMSRERHPDVYVDHLAFESEEFIALWQPSWLSDPGPDDTPLPRVMVALGWWRGVRFEVSGSGPFVGLRVRASQYPELRRAVGTLVAEGAIGKQAFPGGNPLAAGGWVRYRSIPVATERYWDDLGPYRKALVGAVAEAWAVFADVVDTALPEAEGDKAAGASAGGRGHAVPNRER